MHPRGDRHGDHRPTVRLGTKDKDPISDDDDGLEEGGSVMGPNHPVFTSRQSPAPRTDGPMPPPGARFDPISPLRPMGSGEPDGDELRPPGPEGDDPAQTPRIPHFLRRGGRGGGDLGGGGSGTAPFFK